MKPLKAILFDLDGTLLDYDMTRELLPRYFERLTAYAAHLLPPRTLVAAINRGSEAILANDGTRVNADVFAEAFYPLVGIEREIMEPLFMDFYSNDFPNLREYANPRPEARRVIQAAFDAGYAVVIATNPFFPAIATQERLRWANAADFPYRKVTSYENSHAAKPNPQYYQEILDELGCLPEEALMVGDEAGDMAAGLLGCRTFLVTSAATDLQAITPPPTYQGTLADLEDQLRSGNL